MSRAFFLERSMFTYALRRILIAIPTLWLVLTLVFLLVRVIPGDPALVVLGDYATEETLREFRHEMGIDRPLSIQYFEYLVNFVRGDLGRSMINQQPIIRQLKVALPYTLDLTISGIIIGIILGIPVGCILALKRNSWLDYLGRILSLAGLSIPAFYLGILLIVWFSIKIDIFPVSGGGDFSDIGSRISHLALPAFSLGIIMMAYIVRITRSSMLEVISSDYIRTAEAKGLKMKKVIAKHALKNAMIPVASVIGIYAAILIGSSVVTEIVFNRPGLGTLIVGAVKQRDYNVLQSIMTVYATIVVLLNLLTDLSYGFFDPRIKYE